MHNLNCHECDNEDIQCGKVAIFEKELDTGWAWVLGFFVDGQEVAVTFCPFCGERLKY